MSLFCFLFLWFYVVQVKKNVQMHSALHCSLRTARSKSLGVGRFSVFFVATLAGSFSRFASVSFSRSLNVYIHWPERGSSVCVHGSTEWMAESVCVWDLNEWVRSSTKTHRVGTVSVFWNHVLSGNVYSAASSHRFYLYPIGPKHSSSCFFFVAQSSQHRTIGELFVAIKCHLSENYQIPVFSLCNITTTPVWNYSLLKIVISGRVSFQ